MKTLLRTASAVALLTLAAVAAHGQSAMRLEVPFALDTPTAQMPAGAYLVAKAAGNDVVPFYKFQHVQSGKTNTVIVPKMVTRGKSGRTVPAEIVFRCGHENCVLAEIYPDSKERGYGFPTGSRQMESEIAKGRAVTIAAR